MPNRMLRDWTGSDKVNSISVQAERFLVRLIMKVDDHGCFYADSRLLKANLFPLLLDNIREADLFRWMAECQKAGLIVLYENAGKKYLQIVDFRQRLDKARSKFPLPTTTDSMEVVNDFPAEVEVEPEVEKKKKAAPKKAQQGIFLKEEIVYPFPSEQFLNQWHRWKVYKKEQHRFSFKSNDSERAALADLVKLSASNEQKAIAIIEQSIAKGWNGLFELKPGFIAQLPVIERSETAREKRDRQLQEEIYGSK